MVRENFLLVRLRGFGVLSKGLKQVQQTSFGMHEVKELLSGLWIVAEDAQHGRSHRLAVDLLNPSHHHTHVSATEFIVHKNLNHSAIK